MFYAVLYLLSCTVEVNKFLHEDLCRDIFLLNILTVICILIQEESTGDITFYMKGADVAMASIVQYNDWLEEEVRL